jgi:hypothetical protein
MDVNEWPNTTERFVAFLDIMGFKDRVWRNDHEDVLKTMEVLAKGINALRPSGNGSNTLLPLFFSDSILVVSRDGEFDSASELILGLQGIMKTAFEAGIPVKGAIAYGRQTSDVKQSVHFGRPLIDAYELEEDLLLYGVALHHTAEKQLNDSITDWGKSLVLPSLEVLRNLGQVLRYKTPMKKGAINHYVVDMFLDTWTFGVSLEDMRRWVAKFYWTVSGSTRVYVDNTMAFLDYCRQPKDGATSQ